VKTRTSELGKIRGGLNDRGGDPTPPQPKGGAQSGRLGKKQNEPVKINESLRRDPQGNEKKQQRGKKVGKRGPGEGQTLHEGTQKKKSQVIASRQAEVLDEKRYRKGRGSPPKKGRRKKADRFSAIGTG